MQTYRIIDGPPSRCLEFAEQELSQFLEKTTSLVRSDDHAPADYVFRFLIDTFLPVAAFAIDVNRDATATYVTLSGHDDASTLHALYAMLRTCGITFDILHPILPDTLNLRALRSGRHVTTPKVRKRGIRQHINFTMDVSSYPLDEALEYIRNLARMGMNHMTFHSYKGQWYGYQNGDGYVHGGNLFYGARHDVPPQAHFRKIVRNEASYTIPKMEPVMEMPETRSRMATEWLNAVIAECKRVGMHVQLSIEPTGTTEEAGVRVCRDVMGLYPEIDTFEIVTPEGGSDDGGKLGSAEDLKRRLAELFGPDILNNDEIMATLAGDVRQIEGAVTNLARNIDIAKALLANPSANMPALAIGAYVTNPDALKTLLPLMDVYTPADLSLAILPSWGARQSVANFRQMNFDAKRIARCMLYSWIEFDGNMYLLQNSVTGTQQLIAYAQEHAGENQIEAIALNHWRTAENRTCIAYAARAMIEGPITPADFYQSQAQALGILDHQAYIAIMAELDELDELTRQKMFNIGFCVNKCWVRPGLRWTQGWDMTAIDEASARFGTLIPAIDNCLKGVEAAIGQEHLRLLANRIECSMIQIACAKAMKGLAAFCDPDNPETLDEAQKQTVSETCDAAQQLAQRYLEKHAEMILDRGGEGMLVNYYATMPNYIEHVRAMYVDGDQNCMQLTCNHLLPTFDAPPAPLVLA
ncbi:MAG: hypothetical protein ACI9X0_002645 [Kiritimatiellia bacterium]|jgi:hypothetical protein